MSFLNSNYLGDPVEAAPTLPAALIAQLRNESHQPNGMIPLPPDWIQLPGGIVIRKQTALLLAAAVTLLLVWYFSRKKKRKETA